MSLFVLSDTHLSLSNDKPMDVFGPRWQGYTEKLRKNWCAVIGENDTVVIPGDISWGMTLAEAGADLKFIDALPGKKIISKGNHDLWWSSVKKNEEFFAANGIGSISLLHNNAYIYEDKLICGSRGWWNDEKLSPKNTDYEKLTAREAGRIRMSIEYGRNLWSQSGRTDEPEILMFLHFPPVFRDYECTEIIDVLEKYGVRRCFYGHVHMAYDTPSEIIRGGTSYFITSADYLGFVPLKIC